MKSFKQHLTEYQNKIQNFSFKGKPNVFQFFLDLYLWELGIKKEDLTWTKMHTGIHILHLKSQKKDIDMMMGFDPRLKKFVWKKADMIFTRIFPKYKNKFDIRVSGREELGMVASKIPVPITDKIAKEVGSRYGIIISGPEEVIEQIRQNEKQIRILWKKYGGV